MKQYKAPMLYVDIFAADTTIAASATVKNGNADNNQNCWACNMKKGDIVGENMCAYTYGTEAYDYFC